MSILQLLTYGTARKNSVKPFVFLQIFSFLPLKKNKKDEGIQSLWQIPRPKFISSNTIVMYFVQKQLRCNQHITNISCRVGKLNSELVVAVIWCCYLVLHTFAQISQSARVLTNGDFSVLNKPVAQRRRLIGLVLRLCCDIFRKWKEGPFEENATAVDNFCFTRDMNVTTTIVWQSSLQLTYSHPITFKLHTTSKTCRIPRHCGILSTKSNSFCH